MRLIDADAIFNGELLLVSDEAYDAVHAVIEKIYNAPTIDAEPVMHGHWDEEMGGYICSACEGYSVFATNYCPYCGSKMEINEWEEPEINPCRGCIDYDGKGGCRSNGGCGVEINEVEDD